MLQRKHSGDGCDLASTLLCKYYLFVRSWARLRRVRRESLYSELLMCGGGVRSIASCAYMPRDNRCSMYMAQVCFMSVVVTVWGSVAMFVV